MKSRLLFVAAAVAIVPVSALAQTSLRVTAQTGAGPVTVFEGASVPIQSDGREVSTQFSVSNAGTSAITVNQISVSGAGFTVPGIALPITLTSGASFSFSVRYAPGSGGAAATADASISYTEANQPRSLNFRLIGTAPAFVVAYALQTDGNARPLSNDGRLTFGPTAAATTTSAEVIIANQGTGPGTVRSVTLSGISFQLTGLPLMPATVQAGQALRFTLQFNPRQLGSYAGLLRIELEDRTISATVEGSTSDPNFALAYVDPATRNILSLADGGTLVFAPTPVSGNSTYTVVLRNQGPGTGFVNGVHVEGTGFQLIELPALPATVEPSADLRFGIRFLPQVREQYSGALRVDLSTGSLRVPLSGSGIGANFVYEVADPDGEPARLSPGGEVSLSASVGQTVSKIVRVKNEGNTEAEIATITVSGAGFQVSNVPFLPVTLPVGGSQSFTLNFAPTQAGAARGRLRIGDQSFDVSGSGIAPRLVYSYTNEAGTTPVAENGTIILTPVRVGDSSRVQISIQNTGTSSQTISSIDIVSPNQVFALESLPILPTQLNAGSELRLTLRFTPNSTDPVTGSLRVNNTTFTLSASGREPVALPEYRVEGLSGIQEPMQQPGIRLTLASGYALPVRGTLTLAFISEVFASNPAVQFASGGRTIGFTIPANSTRAVFDNGSTEVKIQTGTVAGTIQVTPTFATQTGLPLTTASGEALSITVNRAAPKLLSVDITSRTTNAVALYVTGYATTRALRQVTVQLTPRGDDKFTATTLTINVESAALGWFQSSQSEPFGGLFSLSIPLTFQRDANEDLVGRVQSFTVTAANEVGASNPVAVAP